MLCCIICQRQMVTFYSSWQRMLKEQSRKSWTTAQHIIDCEKLPTEGNEWLLAQINTHVLTQYSSLDTSTAHAAAAMQHCSCPVSETSSRGQAAKPSRSPSSAAGQLLDSSCLSATIWGQPANLTSPLTKRLSPAQPSPARLQGAAALTEPRAEPEARHTHPTLKPPPPPPPA